MKKNEKKSEKETSLTMNEKKIQTFFKHSRQQPINLKNIAFLK